MSTHQNPLKLVPPHGGYSKNILAENIEKLKLLFPEVFAEGKIDFPVLKEVLGQYIEDKDERYSFTWNGKSRARRIAQTPNTGTLRPVPEESVNWDSGTAPRIYSLKETTWKCSNCSRSPTIKKSK